MNNCSVCKKQMSNVDKLCFVCLECAITGAQEILDKWAATKGEWQCCPKCGGQGAVCKPPGLPAEVTNWTSDESVFVRDVCNRAKILATPKT